MPTDERCPECGKPVEYFNAGPTGPSCGDVGNFLMVPIRCSCQTPSPALSVEEEKKRLEATIEDARTRCAKDETGVFRRVEAALTAPGVTTTVRGSMVPLNEHETRFLLALLDSILDGKPMPPNCSEASSARSKLKSALPGSASPVRDGENGE